jgi:hypothetical protein
VANPHSCTVLSLLPPARHQAYGFLPVPRVDLVITIAAARHGQEAARIEPILRDEVCNRSDDGNPPLELPERTEQILASRAWLPPMKLAS